MKNKESILKKEIDIANLSVSIIPTIAFIIIFAFAFSVSVLGEYYTDTGFDLITSVKAVTTGFLNLSYLNMDFIVTLIGGFFIAFWNFSFLLNKNHARAVLLQPKKRSTLFNKKAFLSLIAMVFVVIAIKIIALIINIKYAELPDGYIATFIADTLISLTTLFWGYMCGVAGTILPNRKVEAILGGVSLALLPSSLINVVNYSATAFLRGYTFDDFAGIYNLNILDPLREIYAYSAYAGVIKPPFIVPVNSFIHSAIWIAVSVVGLILIKGYFEKNYKFENCGMLNKNKVITFLTGFSLPVIISSVVADELAGIFNPNSNVIHIAAHYRNSSFYERLAPPEPFVFLGVFVILAITLSLIFNIISTMKIGNLKEKGKPIIAIVSSTIIISLLCLTGGLGYENNLPDKEDIAKIQVEAPYDIVENNFEIVGVSDYYDVEMSVLREDIEFDDSEDFDTILNIHSFVIDDKNEETTERIKFTYELKDGSKIVRSYRYIGKDSAEEILKLWNTNKVKEIYKVLLLDEGLKENDEFNYSFWGLSRLSMGGNVYIQSKDAVVTSLKDVLSEKEIKELKEALYKDVTSLAHFEWFKPTESYGLLKFYHRELENQNPGMISTNDGVSFQITKEMVNTVEFLKSHDLMKFFEVTKQPVKVYLADANELGEYYKEIWKEVYLVSYRDSYPIQHRMMFTSETSVSGRLYLKDGDPMFDANSMGIKDLTAEEYQDYIKKAHIKYFSGEGGKLLIVAYPESNCAYALMVVEN